MCAADRLSAASVCPCRPDLRRGDGLLRRSAESRSHPEEHRYAASGDVNVEPSDVSLGFVVSHLKHTRPRDREVELEDERIAPRSSLLALGHRHGTSLTVPCERYACGRLGGGPAAVGRDETIRRGEA